MHGRIFRRIYEINDNSNVHAAEDFAVIDLRLVMMHTEMGDPSKADDAEVELDEEPSEELLEEMPEETAVLPEEETVVMPETVNSDNVGDVSVEINVEELVAEIEASQGDDAHKKKEIRKRLEEIQEQKQASREIGDTFNFDLDEDD